MVGLLDLDRQRPLTRWWRAWVSVPQPGWPAILGTRTNRER